MLPYKLRAPVYGSVEENKLGKTNGSDQDVSTGGGPMPKAIASDLKAFQTSVVTHFYELHDNDGMKWGDGKAFGMFKHLFSAGKIGLLHWLIPHVKCDQEAFAQIIYAACFECFRDSRNLMERCAAVMILYTLYETCPLVRTEDLKPEEYIPVGLQWREYPRALFRRAFRQRIRVDRTNFIQLRSLREECHIFIDKAHGEEGKSPLVGVAGDTIVILERLSSHWDFCEYTGPVGLEAMAGHPDYPYRDYQQDEKSPSYFSDQGKSPTAGAEETMGRQSQLKAVVGEYLSSIQAIYLGSVKTKLASDLRKTLNPVLPQEGKPSWLSRISGAESHELILGRPSKSRDDGKSTIDREDEVDAFKSRPFSIPEHQTEHRPTHRLLVRDEEISEESQKLLEDALEVIIQRHGLSFFKKGGDFQVGDGASDLSTLGGVGAATVATGQGRAALDALLATADVSARIPTRVGATSTRERYQEPPNTSWDRFLYAGLLDVDTDSQEDDSSNISNVSFDSIVQDEDDDNDEASAATSAIGQRALDLLLNKVSKAKTKSTSARDRKPTRRNPLTHSQDDQSQASSIGVGQAAMRLLLHQVDSTSHGRTTSRIASHNDGTVHDDAKPPARKRKRTKPQGVQPPQSWTDTRRPPDDQSITSSVGGGNMALGELLKLANRPVSRNKATSDDEANPHTRTMTRSNAQGLQPPQPRTDTRRKMEMDEQSRSSSVGPGNIALGDLLKLATYPASLDDETSHDEAKPPARKQTRSKAEGMPPPRVRIDSRRRGEPDEQSMASSVGPGNMALGELLKLAGKKSGNRS